MSKPYPKTASGFMRVLHDHATPSGPRWSAVQETAEDHDRHGRVKWVFSIERVESQRLAWVEHAHGCLIVCLLAKGARPGSDYWFNLDRLHEDYPHWSWAQQISGKQWESPEHFALLDELCRLFPTCTYAKVSKAA